MGAHGQDTWAEAARIVLDRIAADPANSVNRHAFTAADLPPTPRRRVRDHGVLVPVFTSTICLYLPCAVLSHVGRLTSGTGWTSAQAVGAVLAVARRLDDGAAYLPDSRS